MAGAKKSDQYAGIGSSAVEAKTGKGWADWLKRLDAAGCKEMNHKEIVAVVSKRYPRLGGWWVQMVTVGYEQAHGLREKHQKPTGYEIGVSKTVGVSVSKLYSAWKDARTRRLWLPGEKVTIRKANANKSMRITWSDGETDLDVNFYSKGRGKAQVAIQHGKLKNAKDAAKRKAYCGKRLADLKAHLEA